jgi:hypothetical protein
VSALAVSTSAGVRPVGAALDTRGTHPETAEVAQPAVSPRAQLRPGSRALAPVDPVYLVVRAAEHGASYLTLAVNEVPGA